MTFILFAVLLNQPDGIRNYFVRFKTSTDCVATRIYMEKKYGTNNFSGFCTKEVIK